MLDTITLVRGDDTDYNTQVLLVVNYITNLNIEGYKTRLTIENPTNVIRTYEIQNNTSEINFDKVITSTLEVGTHKCSIKLINTLNQVKTVHNFEIKVESEFDITVPFVNEYEIKVKIDDGINKYKNYDELFNKPLINGVILEGDKSFEDLGIVDYVETTIDDKIENHNTDTDSHEDIRAIINTKQNILRAGSNITIIDGIISALGAEGGVTTDYIELGNKPKVNNVTLEGNITLEELGIQPVGEYVTEEMLENKGYLTEVPSGYVTEQELAEYNFLTEIPQEYYTNAQNKLIYATIDQLNAKQNTLIAGENIELLEDTITGGTIISSSIPEEYITEDELIARNYVTNNLLNTQLAKKQNLLRAGNNISFYQNSDGSYTISAVNGENAPLTTSYNPLTNKPRINGIELIGNKSLVQLGIQPAGEYSPVLTAGENITIESEGNNTVISANIPDDICTDEELNIALSFKADKGTTLAEYDISDAYTKEQTDNLINNNLEIKVSDIIKSAPNTVLRYTEHSVTLQSDTTILFADGLNTDKTLKNLEIYNENDLTLYTSGLEFTPEFKDFYVLVVYENNIVRLLIVPQNKVTYFDGETIPITTEGFVKHIYKNRFYEMIDGTPLPICVKIIGAGTSVADNDGYIKITSLTPCGVYRLGTQDDIIELKKHIESNYQTNLTFGDNFTVENGLVTYQIPPEYINIDYLLDNDYVTQTNINDAVRIHNTNSLSHADIRQDIANISRDYITSTSLNNRLSNYVTTTALNNSLNNYCTKAEYNSLVVRVEALENRIQQLTQAIQVIGENNG